MKKRQKINRQIEKEEERECVWWKWKKINREKKNEKRKEEMKQQYENVGDKK